MKSYLIKFVWICIIAVWVLSVLPNLISTYWLFDLFSHYKLQYALAAFLLLLVVLFLFQKKRLAVVLLTVTLLWNIGFLYPYYFHQDPVEATDQADLKIGSINLWSGNTDFNAVQNYILKEDPDILALVEFNPFWEKNLKPILEKYRYKKLLPRSDNFGIALLSKIEMKSDVVVFSPLSKPSIVGNFELHKKPVSIIAMHPDAPLSNYAFKSRNEQLHYIVNNRSTFAQHLIIIGDFNTSSFSNHFDKLIDDGLKDSRIGYGLLPTWPANYFAFQTTLDHCLISENIEVLSRTAGENIGSDHLPISVQIRLH